MSGFGDVLTREIPWFTTDPCPTFTTPPPQLLHRSRTVTDGITFAGSNVASSVTGAFTSADLGSTIGSSTSFASSATIVVVTNASSVVMSASTASSAASSTANIFNIDNGAPFDGVQAYWMKVPPGRQRWLFLTCEGEARDELVEFQGHHEVIYNLVATIYWGFAASSGKLEEEQQNLHDAVNSVLTRIRGTSTDHSHNSQFIAAAVGGPEGDGRISVRMQNSYGQLVAGEPLFAEIRYTVADWIPGAI